MPGGDASGLIGRAAGQRSRSMRCRNGRAGCRRSAAAARLPTWPLAASAAARLAAEAARSARRRPDGAARRSRSLRCAPVVIDVTRLVARLINNRLPTGVDRVSLAYIAHYRAPCPGAVPPSPAQRPVFRFGLAAPVRPARRVADGRPGAGPLAGLAGRAVVHRPRQCAWPGDVQYRPFGARGFECGAGHQVAQRAAAVPRPRPDPGSLSGILPSRRSAARTSCG